MSDIPKDARTIADIVNNTHIDDRGILFKAVAKHLRADAQGYTAGLFQQIGHAYGFPRGDDERVYTNPSCFGKRLGVEACNHGCPVSDKCYSDE